MQKSATRIVDFDPRLSSTDLADLSCKKKMSNDQISGSIPGSTFPFHTLTYQMFVKSRSDDGYWDVFLRLQRKNKHHTIRFAQPLFGGCLSFTVHLSVLALHPTKLRSIVRLVIGDELNRLAVMTLRGTRSHVIVAVNLDAYHGIGQLSKQATHKLFGLTE